jgi:hypothetical protein
MFDAPRVRLAGENTLDAVKECLGDEGFMATAGQQNY